MVSEDQMLEKRFAITILQESSNAYYKSLTVLNVFNILLLNKTSILFTSCVKISELSPISRGTKVGKMLAPERYTAELCMVAR